MAAKRNKAQATVDEEVRNTGIWLEAVELFQDQLTDWEKDFVANCSDRFETSKLTPAQYATLEKLYRKFY